MMERMLIGNPRTDSLCALAGEVWFLVPGFFCLAPNPYSLIRC